MTFEEYAERANQTVIYPNRGNNIVYPTLGLAGEGGEVCEKVKKLFRDNNGEITEEFKEDITKELGDILWYIAAIASELNIPLEEVAAQNIEKISSRKERKKLKGSGDNR